MTIESSGIAIGMAVADEFKCRLVFAKKGETINQSEDFYQSDVYSYTYQKEVHIRISKEFLNSNDKVLIVDDFLANGEAMRGLIDIVDKSGAKIIGCGAVIEKGFQAGGKNIRDKGIDLYSLAIIDKIDVENQKIVFRGV